MSCLTESATLKSITFFYLVTFYHVRFCNCLVLCLYFSISLKSMWSLFKTLHEGTSSNATSLYEITLFRQLAFTRVEVITREDLIVAKDTIHKN